MDKRKVNAEKKRLISLLDKAEVPAQRQDFLAAVIDNMAWQRLKLDEAREEMQDASIVCHYDNGGGQEGERENPIFKAYVNLWRAYMAGLDRLAAYLPKDIQEEVTGGLVHVLAQVQEMKKAGA